MTNRNIWTFSYPASKVLEGAKAREKHHTERMAFWESTKKEVIKRIKDEGLEFDESLANFSSNSYRDMQVTVRNDLLQDMNECNQKIREHRGHAESYNGWVQVLATQGDSSLALDQNDWLYFFGLNVPEEIRNVMTFYSGNG